MEMVVDPNRVKAQFFGQLCDFYCFVPFGNRVDDRYKFHLPTLGNEYTKNRVALSCHNGKSPVAVFVVP